MVQRWDKAFAGWRRTSLGVLIATLMAILVIAAVKPAEAVTECGSIQSRVNNAAAGATVNLPDGCIYRETVTISKPLILIGGPGVEIRGSNVWTGWTKSGSYWVKGKLPDFPVRAKTYCEEGTSRCHWPEQVFFDGKPLVQVASNPTSGQFAVNGSRQVVLADNPTGHVVEVTTRRQWVVGKSRGVTVEGFRMRHAATDTLPRRAAITNGGYSDWKIRNNVLSDAHGAIVDLTGGTNLQLVGNDISRGGQMGVHGTGGSLLVQNNKIHHNNTESFSSSWGAAGMKTTALKRLTAVGNEVYANYGQGLHCDMNCTNAVFKYNRIHHNLRMGINFEISSGAKIFGNALWENGWGKSGWGWGGGIVSSSSKNVEVYDNTLAWNADGISVISQDRGGTDHDAVTNVYVHNNTILKKDYPSDSSNFSLAWLQAWTGVMFVPLSNNRGSSNRYWYPSAEGSLVRFSWGSDGKKKLAEFNATPGEEGGRYMSEAEKNQVVTQSGVPASPEPH